MISHLLSSFSYWSLWQTKSRDNSPASTKWHDRNKQLLWHNVSSGQTTKILPPSHPPVKLNCQVLFFFLLNTRKLAKIRQINHIDKPDKLHLAGRVNKSAGPRGAEWSRAENSAESERERVRQWASERERQRVNERGAQSGLESRAGWGEALPRLQPYSGYGQIARARLFPGWQDTKLPNQPRPSQPITSSPL